MTTYPTWIAYDLERLQPGCVMVQACLGGDESLCVHFDTEDWLVAPTPAMRLYPVESEAHVKRLAMLSRASRT